MKDLCPSHNEACGGFFITMRWSSKASVFLACIETKQSRSASIFANLRFVYVRLPAHSAQREVARNDIWML
jgi:hypothetical protein